VTGADHVPKVELHPLDDTDRRALVVEFEAALAGDPADGA
jgi:hypothetical protein